MFDEINLAVKRDTNAPKKEQIARIKLISFICLFAVAAISIIIFFMNLHYSTGGIKKQQTQVIQSLSPYSDTVAKIYILNSRLSDINTILAKRRDFTKDAGTVINSAGSGIVVNNLQVDSQNHLTVSATSASLSDLNDFLNNVLKLSSRRTVGDVKLTGLKSAEGGFQMSMDIALL